MKTNRSTITFLVPVMWIISILVALYPLPVAAESETQRIDIMGKRYEFEKDNHFEFHKAEEASETTTENTYGFFFLEGNLLNSSVQGSVPSFQLQNGTIEFFYNYIDKLLNAEVDTWHLADSRNKKVENFELPSDVLKGAIIVQTSSDRKNWVNAKTITNAFAKKPVNTNSIYSPTNVQLINGCFYRVIVVYELSKRIEASNFFIFNIDKYENKKIAEVYEFYISSNEGTRNSDNLSQTYSLGEKVKADQFDGYFGEKIIDKSDIHYGWELGNFFVSGYTDKVFDSQENPVFLKNLGDKVTLWFRLNHNINALNGKDNLKITADPEGYDQYFETPRMNLGKGVMIIRYTDHNNIKSEPTIYANYLEANTVVGADTKVQLFEEGDYEVALDYQVTSDELIDKVGHYRIFFKFSVRNGNCMVYPFDVETGNELTNSSMTEKAFKLDLAKSRYLKINVKREVLKESADGLVEDTRFNGPAKDGAVYSDEGIYTITVSNQYTNQFTVKKIYVGTNNILKAYMKTGLSIPEINNLVSQGAEISGDGTIKLANQTETNPTTDANQNQPTGAVTETNTPEGTPNVVLYASAGVIAFLVIIVIVLYILKKNRTKKLQMNTNLSAESDEEKDRL